MCVDLLIVTLDTKAEETLYLKKKMESLGCQVLLMDTGILDESGTSANVTRHQVAQAGGATIPELLASGDKGKAIGTMVGGGPAFGRRSSTMKGDSRASFR